MVSYGNNVAQNVISSGTGTLTLGAALDGAQSFAAAGIADAATVRFTIRSGSDWEISEGVLGASGTTLTRATVLESSNADALLNLPASGVTVEHGPTAEDMGGGGGGLQSVQIFTTSGTWTKPAGITKIRAWLYGSGGGGGGCDASATYGAGGGGSGGFTLIELDVTAFATLTVTIGSGGYGGYGGGSGGSGGHTSLLDGATVKARANGGGGGSEGSTNAVEGGFGASSNNTGTPDIFLAGVYGGNGLTLWGGIGGNSPFNGSSAKSYVYNYNGHEATAYGGGGGGASTNGTSSYQGGNGKPGLIIIEEYA